MKHGIVELKMLIEYVEMENPKGESLHGNSSAGRKYGKQAKSLTESIPEEQGFYLWGKYERNGLWKNIYLGKAGYGMTAHLRSRILEELKDERQFLWCSVFTEEQLFAKGQEFYRSMWKTYINHWRRAIAKAGTSHIVWVATPEVGGQEVPNIEKDLIETLNPTANLMRAAPPSSLQPFTRDIIACFRQEIHRSRPRTSVSSA